MLYVKDTHKGDLVTQLVENGAVISREDVYGLKPADIWMVTYIFMVYVLQHFSIVSRIYNNSSNL